VPTSIHVVDNLSFPGSRSFLKSLNRIINLNRYTPGGMQTQIVPGISKGAGIRDIC